MKIRLHSEDEPLRMALAFLVVALLLPLAVMIWLFQKSLQAERSLAHQELIAAYRQQFVNLAKERGLAWDEYFEQLPWGDESCREVLAWMDRGGIDAMLLVGKGGELLFPPLEAAGKPDGAGLRALLRQTELALPGSSEFAGLMGRWENLFASRVPQDADMTLRQRAFLAERLLALDASGDLSGPALHTSLQLERSRFRLQEELVKFYYQQDWSLPDNAERWLYFMRPSMGDGGESIVNYIKEVEGGGVVLQIRESVFGRWLEPLWQGEATASPVWTRVISPTGVVLHDGAPDGFEAFATMDLPAPFYRWTLQLGFTDANYLTRSSRQQTLLSVYAGAAIVLLVLFSGFLAVRQIRRQIQLNKLKNDFIGMVSHELRTPLASMRMLVDTLVEGRYRDQDTVREYAGLIAGETHRLSKLVDNFLTFTRMQRGKSNFRMSRVDPHEVVAAALSATRSRMEDPSVAFTVEVEPDLPPLRADEDALATVIINLLENAYKYTGEQKRISLRVRQEAGHLRVDVEDNGIGISPREQKLIFREFYQVDNRLARRSEGSGLGLSINRHIVRAHNGRIEVRSRPGEGSCFSVFIPLS